MKKFVYLFFVAVIGGITALGINYYVSPDQEQNGNESITIPHRSERVPSSLVNQMDDQQVAGLPDFTEAAEKTVNSVVHIRAEFERRRSPHHEFFNDDFFDFFFGPRERPSQPEPQPRIGSGSGVILGPEGHIITNNHVVDDAMNIEVTLYDNRVYDAEVIGSDSNTDLALLKIDADDLPYITFADSDQLRVGEWVLAVGNPFNLSSTVTAGIVSAKGRNINILQEEMAIEAFIQTDAAVNRGNSGGALVNTHGELVGINTAIASTTGTFAGYSFAVPSNIAAKVVEDLLEYGEVQRGMLGVEISELTSRRAEELDLDIIQGAYIEQVRTNSAAEEAGLQEGDVITGIDETTITNPSKLVETVARKRPGDEIRVRYHRNGEEQEVTATLKNIYGEVAAVTREERGLTDKLGARFSDVPEEDLDELNVEQGVQVSSISRGILANAGVRVGFVITHIDKEPVESPDDVMRLLEGKTGGVLLEGVYPDGRHAYYGIGMD